MLRRILCLAAAAAALPVVEITTATYETASDEIGAPWLIEARSRAEAVKLDQWFLGARRRTAAHVDDVFSTRVEELFRMPALIS